MNTLFTAWPDAYRAFVGAFDTPVARRQNDSEYANDARVRLEQIDMLMKTAIKMQREDVEALAEEGLTYFERAGDPGDKKYVDAIRALLRSLAAKPQVEQDNTRRSWWFIEQPRSNGREKWWAGGTRFDLTNDPDKAVHFPSRFAAEMFIRIYGSAWSDCIATEHMYIAAKGQREARNESR